ncbi:MAG: chorismate synthase, partial [Lachnospiraceae bacterium]|nr:chorismate synthase [Lachnospiraceae bacterium]
LAGHGIRVLAKVDRIAGISDRDWNVLTLEKEETAVSTKQMPVLDDRQGEQMLAEIEKAKLAGDSVGGLISCKVHGFPAGIGTPIFDGLENRLAQALFGIPAVKGLEFGNGFAAAELCGSENNDAFRMQGGRVVTTTNHHGGILGGISSGMPIRFRLAVKPTASIYQPQQSVSLSERIDAELQIRGRHDPCIVLRAVPVVEAMTALVLCDMLAEEGKL